MPEGFRRSYLECRQLLSRRLAELFLLSDGWHYGDLSDQAGAPPTNVFPSPKPYVRADRINSVVYVRDEDDHVDELFLWTDGWYFGDITAAAGG